MDLDDRQGFTARSAMQKVIIYAFWFAWGGLFCVVGPVFPGGTVDVVLNLVSLDMTATVLSNAAMGRKKSLTRGIWLG